MKEVHDDQQGSYVLAALIIFALAAVFGIFAFQAIKQSSASLYASEETSAEAKNEFTSKLSDSIKPTNEQSVQAGSSAQNTSTAIAGNSDISKKPVLAPSVPVPTSPRDSILAFVAAFKTGDFTSANALISADFALQLAGLAEVHNPVEALETCKGNFVCSSMLGSFTPPEKVKETYSTTPAGQNVAQYSFLLSQVNKSLSGIIGDRNIDVFLVSHAGVWVLHDVYVDGNPLVDTLK